MRNIRSLADQIRDELKVKEQPEKEIVKGRSERAEARKRSVTKKGKADPHEQQVEAFFQAIENFKPEYSEKSMIRLDARTVNLLKRIKLAKNIDMNRFIVYSLHRYLEQHPWLAEHIQETIKNTEL